MTSTESDAKFQNLLVSAICTKNVRAADEYIARLRSTPDALRCKDCGLPIESSADPSRFAQPICSTCYAMVAPLLGRPYWVEIASAYQEELARKRAMISGQL